MVSGNLSSEHHRAARLVPARRSWRAVCLTCYIPGRGRGQSARILEWCEDFHQRDIVWMVSPSPNKPDAVNPAIASRFHAGYHWRGVSDPER